jgi:hypothetical protein
LLLPCAPYPTSPKIFDLDLVKNFNATAVAAPVRLAVTEAAALSDRSGSSRISISDMYVGLATCSEENRPSLEPNGRRFRSECRHSVDKGIRQRIYSRFGRHFDVSLTLLIERVSHAGDCLGHWKVKTVKPKFAVARGVHVESILVLLL